MFGEGNGVFLSSSVYRRSTSVGNLVYAKRQELDRSRRASSYSTLITDKAPPTARTHRVDVVILTPETAGIVGV